MRALLRQRAPSPDGAVRRGNNSTTTTTTNNNSNNNDSNNNDNNNNNSNDNNNNDNDNDDNDNNMYVYHLVAAPSQDATSREDCARASSSCIKVNYYM